MRPSAGPSPPAPPVREGSLTAGSATTCWASGLVDFPLGVMLHARVENLENRPGHMVYGGLTFKDGVFALAQGPESLSRPSWQNWLHKYQFALGHEWIGEVDRFRGEGPMYARASAQAQPFLRGMVVEDQIMWRGWYSRHGGSMTYFGDLFGEGWAPCTVLLALWLALLWTLWGHLPPAAFPAKARADEDEAARKTRRKHAGRKR